MFAETVFYLLLPLARAAWERTGRGYLLCVLAIVAGATMTHSLVPPTPGPLFVTSALGIDIATMIGVGDGGDRGHGWSCRRSRVGDAPATAVTIGPLVLRQQQHPDPVGHGVPPGMSVTECRRAYRSRGGRSALGRVVAVEPGAGELLVGLGLERAPLVARMPARHLPR
jgi:hypothetical protein